ncbi:nuclear transport factor 2 family protein [Novosphingobium sp. PP1Y]|uniref:nuclear transport factor 2 family protein n=1 Tax=Novosphingobium sp. PP1Y TaxID=702113 RepID=UPI00020EF2FA|nr:hypothetical protein [Novosphingobium sp. PP1Y]CCA94354.1 protein of unknown function DUF1486 [Novosphingobium sp. PP1Y]
MPDASNADVIRDYYRAMEEGDFAHVVSLHDPEVTCWMSGTSLVSGRFEQREPLYAHMGEHVLGSLIVGTEDYVKGSRLVLSDGPFVVGLLHGGLPAKGVGRYDQFYLQIFRFENGLIREIVEMFDTVMVETALMKHSLVTGRTSPDRPFILDEPIREPLADRSAMVALAEDFLTAVAEADMGRLKATLCNDAEIRIIGSTPWSGTWGEPCVLGSIFSEGLDWQGIVAADAGGAAGLAKSPNGNQQYGVLLEAREGRIGCVSVFLDTVAAELSAFDNPIVGGSSRSIKPPFDVALAFSALP